MSMSEFEAQTHSADETLALAERVGGLLRGGDVVALAGDLGAGKTVFAKGVARALGVEDPVVSPTFTVVREYPGRVRFVHVDVYRLDRVQELHIKVIHILIELVERELAPENYAGRAAR